MSDSEFAQYAFGGQGVKGERSSPCKQPVRVSGIVSRRLTKDLLALQKVFEKLLGLMEEKIGSEGDLFFTEFVPIAFKNLL